MSFGIDTESRWFLLSDVYARGSKRSHTGGKCVTCSGLANSREATLKSNSNNGQKVDRGHLVEEEEEFYL